MAADDRRIETKTGLLGRGIGTTPERIAQLQERIKEHGKLTKNKPTRVFSQLVGAASPAPQQDALAAKKRSKLDSLPKRGPALALAHPAQREAFGRDDPENHEPVVLKG